MTARGRYLVFGVGMLALLALGLALWAQRGPREVAGLLDNATFQESVDVQVAGGDSQPSASGGARDAGRIQESVEYVIRDASGKIKKRERVGEK